MVILTDTDKTNIHNMEPHCHKYCEFPEDMKEDEIYKWMNSTTEQMDVREIRAFAFSKIHNNLKTMKHDNLKPGRVGDGVGKNERIGR